MKKSIARILLVALLLSLIIPLVTKAGGLQSEYIYIMQVGSKEVSIQKDQEEPKIAFLPYPIVIDTESSSSGIAIESFEGLGKGNASIATIVPGDYLIYAETSPRQTLYTLHHSSLYKTEILTEFKLLYPDGKAWIETSKTDKSNDSEVEIEDLTLPFKPYSVDIEAGSDSVIIIPLRIVFERIAQHQVSWNPVTQEIIITYNPSE
jgi:hypothetical protein